MTNYDSHKPAQFLFRLALGLDGLVVNADSVGGDEIVVRGALCERNSVVKTEQAIAGMNPRLLPRPKIRPIFDQDLDIVERVLEALGERLDGLFNKTDETIRVHTSLIIARSSQIPFFCSTGAGALHARSNSHRSRLDLRKSKLRRVV